MWSCSAGVPGDKGRGVSRTQESDHRETWSEGHARRRWPPKEGPLAERITARPRPSRWPPALVTLAGLSWKRVLRGPVVLMLVQGRGRGEGRRGPEGLRAES